MGIQIKDPYLISYDITDDKRRRKISKLLMKYGERVQYSVFEIFLNDYKKNKLLKKIKRIIKEDEDSIRVYKLNEFVISNIIILGIQKKVFEDNNIIL